MTLHPDEQAREFLNPYFDMLDALGPARLNLKINRDVHSAKLTALLARVRQQALEEAAQIADDAAMSPSNEASRAHYDHGDEDAVHFYLGQANIAAEIAAAIRSLRQAAGEGTKP